MIRRSSTKTIISAMRVLQNDIQSEDGVANAAIGEAADRLEEIHRHLCDVLKHRWCLVGVFSAEFLAELEKAVQ